MSKLYATWQQTQEMAVQTPEQAKAFSQEYDALETEAYRRLLREIAEGNVFTGTVQEMADHYGMDPVFFAGFLDGINESVKEPLILDDIQEDTVVNWVVDPPKLFYNMNAAKASWLYNLEEWDDILSQEERHEITRKWRLSGQVRNAPKPGRNDPCPCGSGKKYKKCCMLKESAQ